MGLHISMTLMKALNNGMARLFDITCDRSSSLIVATSSMMNHPKVVYVASASALTVIILQRLDMMDKSG